MIVSVLQTYSSHSVHCSCEPREQSWDTTVVGLLWWKDTACKSCPRLGFWILLCPWGLDFFKFCDVHTLYMYIVASIESKLICFCLAQSWKPLVMQRLFTTTTQVDLGSSFTCSLTPRDEWMEEKFKTVSFYTHMCTALCWVKYTHCTYSLHNSIGHFLLITASYFIQCIPNASHCRKSTC